MHILFNMLAALLLSSPQIVVLFGVENHVFDEYLLFNALF